MLLWQAGIEFGAAKEQKLLQPPQLLESLEVSTQRPLHTVPEQLEVHWLPWHVDPLGQTALQPPQLNESVASSTQLLSQGEKPLLHWAKHWPALHSGDELSSAGQTVPQPPQLFTSV